MKRFLPLVLLSAGILLGQELKWWTYDVPAHATACQIIFNSADLYKQLRVLKVSESDLKSKFPNVGWGSGKIATLIVSTPREGDLVQNSVAMVDGNVQFRLVVERPVRLTNVAARTFVVEIDRSKVSQKPMCTWSVDAAAPAPASKPLNRTIIRQ